VDDLASSLDVADYVDPPVAFQRRTVIDRGPRSTFARLPDGGREFGYVIDAEGRLLVLDTVADRHPEPQGHKTT
jgi:hypothetical protein